VKIYVAAVEAQEKKKDRVKLRIPFTAPLNANVLFRRFFKNPTLCTTKLKVLVLSFPDFTDISNVSLLQKRRDI
jgi:hypothetical protein